MVNEIALIAEAFETSHWHTSVCFWEEVAWNADHVLDGVCVCVFVRSEFTRRHPFAGTTETRLLFSLITSLRPQKVVVVGDHGQMFKDCNTAGLWIPKISKTEYLHICHMSYILMFVGSFIHFINLWRMVVFIYSVCWWYVLFCLS